MAVNNNNKTPCNEPTILSWDDMIVGDLLGSGSFASVYSVEIGRENLLQEVCDYGNDSDSDDAITAMTYPDECSNDPRSWPQGRLVVKCRESSLSSTSRGAKIAARALFIEASILKSLPRHPNIVSLIGISSCVLEQTSTVGFLVLERVACTVEDLLNEAMTTRNRSRHGGEHFSLDAVFRRKKHLAKHSREEGSRVQRIALGTASAMKFLHSHRVLHRDLKPSNIGLGYDGKVRLLDFGSATIYSENQLNRKLTRAVGTTRYMAPEVSLSESYGPAADVHSFSILLWEVLTLRKAFHGLAKTKDEMKELINIQERRPPLVCVKSRRLRQLLKSGWDVEQERRPTFAHIFKQLETILTSSSKSSHADKPPSKGFSSMKQKIFDLQFLQNLEK